MTDPLAIRNWRRPRDFLRTYSVWDLDGGLELRVLDHGDGPGARWARSLAVGDEVTFNKPEGAFVVQEGAYHLFVGEETAAVAFGPMIRKLAGASVYGVVEVAGPDDRLDLGDGIQWLYRGDRSAAESGQLVEAVRRLELPAEPGVAYVAGEAKTVQMVRDHLVRERDWPRRSVLTKPFWTPGKVGLE
ncbi:siderophore-interacting protein [Acrocarpospora phusangensis]|uniref:siderophore-interacting protein n=1 Tax=Acrocarpospora phusangensis TaxID=1070424 RepID=UPI0019511F14|nr:siderophore-interacting protein [Acrocarpospora phusangensis]